MFDMIFTGDAAWFGIPAALGTIFFVLRLALMLIAGDAGLDGGAVDADVGDLHGDSSEALKLLSLQSLAAFAMGFGWGGLAALHAFDLNWPVSALIGVGVGVLMVWVLTLLLKAVYDLQSSGNISIDDAIGLDGMVYVQIPASGNGRGQVRLVLHGRQRIYSASTDGDAIERGAQVKVTGVNRDNSLTVTAI